jgi:ribosomal protein S18 acetylase RimI-like enzyme
MATIETVAIERLGNDLVAMAQCMVLDTEVFPHPSVGFRSRSPSETVWIARAAPLPRVLGFLASKAGRDVVHIHGLAVSPESRRQGIGRALLRAAIHDAADHGTAAVLLCVSVTNASAIALYESEGFRATRRLRDFYSSRAFGGERDALEMRW